LRLRASPAQLVLARAEKRRHHFEPPHQPARAPIVSVSLGLPAVFLWGGKRRSDPVRRLHLESGDIVVWGGPARFVYHGVAPLKVGQHR
jgi:DNA oxidative demethylase